MLAGVGGVGVPFAGMVLFSSICFQESEAELGIAERGGLQWTPPGTVDASGRAERRQ